MLRRTRSSKRLLQKKVYKAHHRRCRVRQYVRENKNTVKLFQEKFKNMNGPNIKPRRRPKREAISGFKMSYRYKFYQSKPKEEEEE